MTIYLLAVSDWKHFQKLKNPERSLHWCSLLQCISPGNPLWAKHSSMVWLVCLRLPTDSRIWQGDLPPLNTLLFISLSAIKGLSSMKKHGSFPKETIPRLSIGCVIDCSSSPLRWMEMICNTTHKLWSNTECYDYAIISGILPAGFSKGLAFFYPV